MIRKETSKGGLDLICGLRAKHSPKVSGFVIDEKFLGKRFKSQNFDESSERECTYTFSKSLLYTP